MSLRPRSESTLISSLGTSYTTGASPVTLVAAVAGQRIRVYRAVINTIGASTVQFASFNAVGPVTTNISAQYSLAALGVLLLPDANNGDPWWITNPGEALQLLIGGTGPVAADIYYLQGV